MEQYPKTCGRCSGNATSDTCQDKAPPSKPSQCFGLAYLCNNMFYRDLMIEQCPKICCRHDKEANTICFAGYNFGGSSNHPENL
ncbi:hypothetical protein X798_03954 [Onchocerca flexuosa]|uniref:ShKT domain-containing protein n=1 Tax=Onchocerca flexuosa TaxID=387005 RepID=A0A238BVM1_9BILA|nr:hypothetical protein X798_03954 [Onchocerca flexuosa]